jgi:TRAP-type uncharacterized transport system substrate-binding protein
MRTFEYLQLVLKHELVAIKEFFLELRTTFLAIVIILGGLIFYLKPFPITDITFATSYKGGDWYQEAQSAIEPLKEHWINLNVLATNGAVQNADLLIDPNSNVNAAFTYGAALTHEQRKQIYSLGSVSYNPVWIFYREKATGKISNLHELAKHKIALGPVQSGSYVLAKKLFEINSIPVDNNPHFSSYSFEEAEANFIAGKTDSYVFVTSIYDPSVQKLFKEPGIKIMSMLNTSAYERKFSFLDAVTIPAGAIDIDKKYPLKIFL